MGITLGVDGRLYNYIGHISRPWARRIHPPVCVAYFLLVRCCAIGAVIGVVAGLDGDNQESITRVMAAVVALEMIIWRESRNSEAVVGWGGSWGGNEIEGSYLP